MTVLALTHIKGGVTKTTSTINIAYGLALTGHRVLVIDADPQSNCTYTLTGSMNIDNEGNPRTAGTLYEIFMSDKKRSILEIIEQSNRTDNLYYVRSSMWLYNADLKLGNATNRESILKKALRDAKDHFDYVLIDTSPNLGVVTINSWVASDYLLIPVSLTIYGMLGINILETALQNVREEMEIEAPIFGVFGTLDDHTNESKRGIENIRSYFESKGVHVFNTVIPRNISVEEANNRAIPLYEYAQQSTGATAYAHLIKEILDHQKGVNHNG